MLKKILITMAILASVGQIDFANAICDQAASDAANQCINQNDCNNLATEELQTECVARCGVQAGCPAEAVQIAPVPEDN